MNRNGFSATDLAALQRQVTAWRRAQRGRSRLPEDLWTAAAALARSEGVRWVPRALRLDFHRLKRRCTQGAGDALSPAALPAFVEVQLGPSIPEPTHRWRIELHDESANRLTIEMGNEIPALVAVVERLNAQRSVALKLRGKHAWQPAGNVTIPANQPLPQAGEVVEVRYLYAFPESGLLFQPVCIGVRTDITAQECGTAQLKFKQVEDEET
jgi:hypothetical protein